MDKLLVVVFSLLITSVGHTEINLVSSYSTGLVLNSYGTYDEDLNKTVPYSNVLPSLYKIGIGSSTSNFKYSGGYFNKRGTDIYNGRDYSYDGVFLEISYVPCIHKCK